MYRCVDALRATHGVELICKALQIAPSGYWRYAARIKDPSKRCDRAKRDEQLSPHVQRVWDANRQVYGVDKVYKQMNREAIEVARCTVVRLMRKLGLEGVRRGKHVRTTWPDPKAPCPLDRVNRQFKASRPNELWVSDFTYVSTWQGFVYVAFVIDVFARRIVGWRVSRSMRTDFNFFCFINTSSWDVLQRLVESTQYVSIRYTERLAEAGIEPSVVAKVTATTTRWPRPSTGCTKPK